MVILGDPCPSAPGARLPPLGRAWSRRHWGQLCPDLPGDSLEQQPGGDRARRGQRGALQGWSPVSPLSASRGTKGQPLAANHLTPHLAPVPPAWPGHHPQAEMNRALKAPAVRPRGVPLAPATAASEPAAQESTCPLQPPPGFAARSALMVPHGPGCWRVRGCAGAPSPAAVWPGHVPFATLMSLLMSPRRGCGSLGAGEQAGELAAHLLLQEGDANFPVPLHSHGKGGANTPAAPQAGEGAPHHAMVASEGSLRGGTLV